MDLLLSAFSLMAVQFQAFGSERSGFRFRVSGFGFRILGLGFRVLILGLGSPGFSKGFGVVASSSSCEGTT